MRKVRVNIITGPHAVAGFIEGINAKIIDSDHVVQYDTTCLPT